MQHELMARLASCGDFLRWRCRKLVIDCRHAVRSGVKSLETEIAAVITPDSDGGLRGETLVACDAFRRDGHARQRLRQLRALRTLHDAPHDANAGDHAQVHAVFAHSLQIGARHFDGATGCQKRRGEFFAVDFHANSRRFHQGLHKAPQIVRPRFA